MRERNDKKYFVEATEGSKEGTNKRELVTRWDDK